MIDPVKVRRFARREGFINFYQLALGFRKKGYKCSESQAKRFWNGDTDPKLSSLERLCKVLRCRTDDLITANGHTNSLPPKRTSSKKSAPKSKVAKLSGSKRPR